MPEELNLSNLQPGGYGAPSFLEVPGQLRLANFEPEPLPALERRQ